MEHLLLKAATTAATDEGFFEAVISTATIDREKDIVDPAGMVRALQKWVPTGKNIPLAWNHSGAPEHQIGYIDPATAKAVGSEVVAGGWIDQSADSGAHAWRLVKMGTLGFSFGYLIPEGGATKRAGGGNQINELDVFEVTASPTPMNNDTRVLGWKADVPSSQILNAMLGLAQKFISNEDDADDVAMMRAIATQLRKLGAAEGSEPDDAAEDTNKAIQDGQALRRRADDVALEFASGGESQLNVKTPQFVAELVEAEKPDPEPELVPEPEIGRKAQWTAAYINDLPDSAFLHIEQGGEKDSDGKTTPRDLRHFPYKDDSGAVDLPHLRNALARIPQSNLSQSVKDQLTAKAQRILDGLKAVDVTAKEPSQVRAVDPLRRKADAVALEFLSDGESLRKPPIPVKAAPKRKPELSIKELRERTREEMLTALSGGLNE